MNAHNCIISIIVCVYNVENTIRRALDSYLAQTFTDFELILIDDGSLDSSGTICEDYAQKDSRVRVFHKEDEGLAEARNYALKLIEGEYIIQLDPDDWMNSDGLESLYKKAKETDADMVICDYYHNDHRHQTYTSQRPTLLDHNSVLGDIITGKLYGYCWNKLIKVDCYNKYDINFPKEIYGCEDQYSMCHLLLNDIKIAYLPMAFYHYVYNPNGLARYYDEKSYRNALLVRDMFNNLLKDTRFQELSWNLKTFVIVAGAFLHGQKIYSSIEFEEKFSQYKDITLICETSLLRKQLYRLSFNGYYQMAYKIYSFMWNIKRVKNRLINI